TVFIGYPIWWGIAAWPVNGFVAANDFTGKNIVPFCTSLSSGLGDSGSLLAEMAGEGNWFAGHRFQSGASEQDVLDWLSELK
ncbi:MAG TPA: flavodoxin, partial [Candidatus Treponema faecavium]|nr:flavodoxin [Candidatus Treponema faecavium]